MTDCRPRFDMSAAICLNAFLNYLAYASVAAMAMKDRMMTNDRNAGADQQQIYASGLVQTPACWSGAA